MSPLERQLDLLLLLLSRRTPITAAEIMEAMPEGAYPAEEAAAERKFSRDKAELRALGLPLVVVENEDEEDAYAVDAQAFFLPEVTLAPDERAALFATGAAALKAGLPFGGALRRALAALRATGPDGEERAKPVDVPAVVASRAPPAHVKLVESAFLERRRLKFHYPPEAEPRVVRPYGLAHRRGRLLLVAFCELRNGVRTFHVDRLVSPTLATKGSDGDEFTIPGDFQLATHLPGPPWSLRKHDAVDVRLSFSPGWEAVGPRTLSIPDDGRVAATNVDGLVGQVAALGGARIEAPESARKRVLERFSALAKRLGVDAGTPS